MFINRRIYSYTVRNLNTHSMSWPSQAPCVRSTERSACFWL